MVAMQWRQYDVLSLESHFDLELSAMKSKDPLLMY